MRTVLTLKLTDSTTSMSCYDYKPFGDTLWTSAGSENRLGYIGRERDYENNYFAFGARNYDSETGRFLSVDPFFEAFPNHTPYHYAYNSPIQWRDPSGLATQDEKDEVVQSLPDSYFVDGYNVGQREEVENFFLLEGSATSVFNDLLSGDSDPYDDLVNQFMMVMSLFPDLDLDPASSAETMDYWVSNAESVWQSRQMQEAKVREEANREDGKAVNGSQNGVYIVGTNEEVAIIKAELENQYNCSIVLGSDGKIINVSFAYGVEGKGQSWFKDLIENSSNSETGQRLDYKFVDDQFLTNEQGEVGSFFMHPGSIKNGITYDNATVAIPRGIISGSNKIMRYNSNGNLYPNTFSDMLNHEGIGHALDWVSGKMPNNRVDQETNAVNRTNYFRILEGRPIRTCYFCRSGPNSWFRRDIEIW
ncbi:MAG: RHS repeat-associated core domain-containing protein [bacterium]